MRLELITAYKRQITDLQQLMSKRAEEYEAEKRRADDLADRLNFIRKHMDAMDGVI